MNKPSKLSRFTNIICSGANDFNATYEYDNIYLENYTYPYNNLYDIPFEIIIPYSLRGINSENNNGDYDYENK